jgi:hypothetical protein
MTREKQYGANRQIRFTDEIWDRIEGYRAYLNKIHGLNLSYSDIIRALLTESLKRKEDETNSISTIK